MSAPQPTSHPYTCLACGLAFTTAQTQRSHYSTDLHRYNSKRAVAGLVPIGLDTFNEKFNRPSSTPAPGHPDAQPAALRCTPCHKSFSTQNAYHNHLSSKKHLHQTTLKPNLDPAAEKLEPSRQELSHSATATPPADDSHLPSGGLSDGPTPSTEAKPMELDPASGTPLDRMIQNRMAHAPDLPPTQCLFCPRSRIPAQFGDVDQTLQHMLVEHGFFLPDQEFLVDKVGLLKYLAQTIAVWNVCIYCGAGFGGSMQEGAEEEEQELAAATRNGLNSVRKHMCDKNHCKLAWDTQQDRLEYSDFFDYRPSYSNNGSSKKKKNTNKRTPADRHRTKLQQEQEEEEEGSEWEDEEEMEEKDRGKEEEEDQEMESDDGSIGGEEAAAASFGDSMFELVLPNGVRLGHRSLRHIYRQNLLPYSVGSQSTGAGNRNINLITRMAILATTQPSSSSASSALLTKLDRHSILMGKLDASKSTGSLAKAALIPARGGGVNFNHPIPKQQQVIKTKDPGQARFAGHHIRTFKDTHKSLQFQNRVSCKSGNNQTHCTSLRSLHPSIHPSHPGY